MSTAASWPGYPLRRRIVLAVFALVAAGLSWRGVDLQLTNNQVLKTQGNARYLRVVEIPAHRGVITDRRGEPLAISTPVSSIWGTPRRLLAERARWPRLASLLGTDTEYLRTVLEPRADREFVYLKRHVSPDLAERVMALGIDGVALVQEQRRYYPAGEVTAHVLGFTNVDDVGQEGVELAFEGHLSGINGAKRVLRDRLGRIVENVERIRSPQPGHGLALSIDKRIQYLAYRELKSAVMTHRARAGSIVIIDPASGEVLAMVNQPSFNPNNRSDLKGDYYRNRAVTDVIEPGSTIKPLTVSAALDSGAFEPSTRIDTRPGHFTIGRHTVRDVHDYGVLDVTGVLVKSSNVGASKMALALDPEVLWSAFHGVGFGMTTQLGFPGESAGQLRDYQGWREIEHATMAFGYGLSTTVVQLAQAYGVIANDGRLVPLTLVRADGPSPEGKQVFHAQAARAVRAMLEAVVRTGTGTKAAVRGYRVAGKTGTVRKLTGDGYAENRYLSLFAGFVPASNPRLVTVVLIDEPKGAEYYGGLVAAPVFARIMRDAVRLLNIPPDDVVEPDGARLAVHDGDAPSARAAAER
ncbi:MAG: penicillin-binding protein 2 [Gammaproteobacteria bacterium]|nr:penicillin-binding protein 2 [Gammaproteobacteria bacterium]